MKITFTGIPPNLLSEVWPRLRAGCEEAIKASGETVLLPEDVYLETRLGKAVAFLIDDEDEADELGFMVTKLENDVDGQALFVWIIYAKPGVLMANAEQFLAELDALARRAQAKRIRGKSGRTGFWEQGFKLRTHIYEREV